MSKKKWAGLVAGLLTAIAAALTQCPDEPAHPVPVGADAGASLELDAHDVTRTVVQIGAAQ